MTAVYVLCAWLGAAILLVLFYGRARGRGKVEYVSVATLSHIVRRDGRQ